MNKSPITYSFEVKIISCQCQHCVDVGYANLSHDPVTKTEYQFTNHLKAWTSYQCWKVKSKLRGNRFHLGDDPFLPNDVIELGPFQKTSPVVEPTTYRG